MKTTPEAGSSETKNVLYNSWGTSKSISTGKQASDKEVEEYKGPQTTWESWPEDNPFPCFPGESKMKTVPVQRSPSDTGLQFVREMKTASSTVAGVLLRLAHRKGAFLLDEGGLCRMRVDHSSAQHQKYADRDKKRSYLISLLREPTKRAISHFFHFHVSERKTDPTDANFQTFFRDGAEKWSNYYTKDLTMRDIDLQEEPHGEIVNDILTQYNFIAITERMDESLVVFKMLLGLELEDILYMSAKSSGSFTSGPPNRPCIYLTPSFVSKGMKEFFASEYWENYMKADRLLYKAAIKSLDNTIEALGRQKVEQEVATFRKAQEYTQDKCDERTIYRCNSKGANVGRNATCLMWDIGCGYECLNEISVGRDVLGA